MDAVLGWNLVLRAVLRTVLILRVIVAILRDGLN
jgi:hypothetical protein